MKKATKKKATKPPGLTAWVYRSQTRYELVEQAKRPEGEEELCTDGQLYYPDLVIPSRRFHLAFPNLRMKKGDPPREVRLILV